MTSAATTLEPLVVVEDLHTFYGKSHILHGVSLSVGRGEVVGLLGRNGVGKSTTLKTIMGLIYPKQGRILLEGRPVTSTPAHKLAKLGIAYVPEDRRIFRLLTVMENLRTGLDRPGVTDARKQEIAQLSAQRDQLKNRVDLLNPRSEYNRRWPPDHSAATGVGSVVRTGKSELYADIPDEMHTFVVENRDGMGPYGSKAHGDGSMSVTRLAISMAATSVSRSRSLRQASAAALPLRSAPLEAAVAEVLLFFSVDVGMTMTRSGSMENSSATICLILVLTPCPISVAPVET